MPALKTSLKCFLSLLCVAVLGAECGIAQQEIKPPTTWWPDPSTGLMWAGQAYAPPPSNPKDCWGTGVSWQDAKAYCDSLKLGGFPGWRLPTVDEVKAATVIRTVFGDPNSSCIRRYYEPAWQKNEWEKDDTPSNVLSFKGGLEVPTAAWTSTIRDSASAYTSSRVLVPWDMGLLLTRHAAALCIRPMEADPLQIAKDAQVDHPVPDVQTLRNYIPLNKARLAFQAGQYQESVTQAQSALALKADPGTAYWGIGISYGMLGKWDEAIANLNSALQLDKKNKIFKRALKWAKDGQKAAEKGRPSKGKPPLWN